MAKTNVESYSGETGWRGCSLGHGKGGTTCSVNWGASQRAIEHDFPDTANHQVSRAIPYPPWCGLAKGSKQVGGEVRGKCLLRGGPTPTMAAGHEFD